MSDQNIEPIQIAIDGPVAAGKGAVAQGLSRKLNYLNVDTGATYRVATLLALTNGVDVRDELGILELIKNAEIEIRKPTLQEEDGRWNTVLLNGRDVSNEIRKNEIAVNVAKVASLPKVREELVEVQRKISSTQNVVMEGRDITSVVLPDAKVKIYLDAEVGVRARRRWQDRLRAGEEVQYDQVLKRIKTRDEMDMNREASPLVRTKNAVYIDSTDMEVDEVVSKIVEVVESKS